MYDTDHFDLNSDSEDGSDSEVEESSDHSTQARIVAALAPFFRQWRIVWISLIAGGVILGIGVAIDGIDSTYSLLGIRALTWALFWVCLLGFYAAAVVLMQLYIYMIRRCVRSGSDYLYYALGTATGLKNFLWAGGVYVFFEYVVEEAADSEYVDVLGRFLELFAIVRALLLAKQLYLSVLVTRIHKREYSERLAEAASQEKQIRWPAGTLSRYAYEVFTRHPEELRRLMKDPTVLRDYPTTQNHLSKARRRDEDENLEVTTRRGSVVSLSLPRDFSGDESGGRRKRRRAAQKAGNRHMPHSRLFRDMVAFWEHRSQHGEEPADHKSTPTDRTSSQHPSDEYEAVSRHSRARRTRRRTRRSRRQTARAIHQSPYLYRLGVGADGLFAESHPHPSGRRPRSSKTAGRRHESKDRDRGNKLLSEPDDLRRLYVAQCAMEAWLDMLDEKTVYVERGRESPQKDEALCASQSLEAAKGFFDFIKLRSDYKDVPMLTDLSRKDFECALPGHSEDSVDTLFSTLDSNAGGTVCQREVTRAFTSLLGDKSALSFALFDCESVVRRLDTLLNVCLGILAFPVGFVVFEVSITRMLFTFSPLVVAFAFVFGSTASSVFRSIIFLFVVKPFDVGDRVLIEGRTYNVLQIHLMTTTCRYRTGVNTIFSNDRLLSKDIANLRRSSDIRHWFDLDVANNTPDELIVELERRCSRFVAGPRRSVEFYPEVAFFLIDLKISHHLRVRIGFQQRASGQSSTLYWTNKTSLVRFLKKTTRDLNITVMQPTQFVRQISHNGPDILYTQESVYRRKLAARSEDVANTVADDDVGTHTGHCVDSVVSSGDSGGDGESSVAGNSGTGGEDSLPMDYEGPYAHRGEVVRLPFHLAIPWCLADTTMRDWALHPEHMAGHDKTITSSVGHLSAVSMAGENVDVQAAFQRWQRQQQAGELEPADYRFFGAADSMSPPAVPPTHPSPVPMSLRPLSPLDSFHAPPRLSSISVGMLQRSPPTTPRPVWSEVSKSGQRGLDLRSGSGASPEVGDVAEGQMLGPLRPSSVSPPPLGRRERTVLRPYQSMVVRKRSLMHADAPDAVPGQAEESA